MKQSRKAVFFFLVFVLDLLTWSPLSEPMGSLPGRREQERVVLLFLWWWFTEGGAGPGTWQMEPVGACVCMPRQVPVWGGFWPLPGTCSFYCLHMLGSHLVWVFPDFLCPRPGLEIPAVMLRGTCVTGSWGDGLRLVSHTAASSRSFTGPEVWLQKGCSWTVFSSPIFSTPHLFLLFCLRLHVLGIFKQRSFLLCVCVCFFLSKTMAI